MKYVISLLFISALMLPAGLAQTEKGAFSLGTTTNLVGIFSGAQPNQISLGFGTNKVDKYLEAKYTNFNLSFNAGYFVANGLMLGLDLQGWNTNNTVKLKDESGRVIEETEDTYTSIGLTPKARLYLNRDRKLQFFGELRGGLVIQKLNDEDSDTGALLGAKGGGAYFVNPKVALDFFFDFSGIFSEIQQVGGSNTSVIEGNLGIGAGFTFFL